MKKLMTVAAAALCATAFGAIESTNIVGYQTKALNVGGGASVFTFVAPTFLTVGGETGLKLGDFKLTYAGNDCTKQNVGLLDRGGAVVAEYYYVNDAASTEESRTVGWHEKDGEDGIKVASADAVSIPYGQGFVLYNADENTKIVFTGAVNPVDAEVECDSGLLTFTGNCQPKAIYLEDLMLDYGDDLNPLSKKLYKMSPNGGVEAVYYYVSPDVRTDTGLKVGWYTDMDFKEVGGEPDANKVALAPGEGFAIYSRDDTVILVVPKAL